MKITVTQDDIKNGVPASEHSCPIALAIRRETKATRVRVGHYTFSWWDANHHRLGDLPE